MKRLLPLILLFLLLPVIVFSYLQFFFCKDLDREKMAPYILQEAPGGLDIRFYGTGYFYIGDGTKAVMTDPFFSAPSAFASFFNLHARPASLSVVDTGLWKNVKAFVVGHSHYDHCLELPGAMDKASGAFVLGNTSLSRLYPSLLDTENFRNADSATRFYYAADSSVRIYPGRSVHSPHIGNILLASGDNATDFSRLPKNWLRWKCGNNYSYLIDFMDGDTIQRRVFVSGGDNGFPYTTAEKAMIAEKQPDLLIMPFWNAKVMEDRIRRARKAFGPTPLVICHWNNFFRPATAYPQYIRRSQLETALPEMQALFPDMPLKIMLPEQNRLNNSY